MRLIDADKLKSMYSINRANFNTVVGIQKWIDNAPTVQAVPLSVLQEIRQEIDTLASDNNVVIYNLAIQDVQEIIDKHIKEIEG